MVIEWLHFIMYLSRAIYELINVDAFALSRHIN